MDKARKNVVLDLLKDLYPDTFKQKVEFSWCLNELSLKLYAYESYSFNMHLSEEQAKLLDWTYNKSSKQSLPFDGYLSNPFNCLVVIDEFYKFSSYRLKSMELYPPNLKVFFNLQEYKQLCIKHMEEADEYQKGIKRPDFDFEGGATAERAMMDFFLDLKPPFYGLNPTLRLHEFELEKIDNTQDLEVLIKHKIKSIDS